MSISIRIPLIVLICGLSIPFALPIKAMNVDKVEHAGQKGGAPVINFYTVGQRPGTQAQPQAQLVDIKNYSPKTLRGFIAKACSEFFSRSIPMTTKMIGGAILAGTYVLLKTYLVSDSHSRLCRIANIALNGLSGLSSLHVLHAASKAKPELAPGVLGLLLGASPVLVSDTLALKSGHAGLFEVMPSHSGSRYLHGVTEGMRALGIIYAAGQCVSWFKNKIVRSCNAYLEREKRCSIAQ